MDPPNGDRPLKIGERVDWDAVRAAERERYTYSDAEWDEIRLMLRLSMPTGARFEPPTLREDYDGSDGVWIVNARCPVAIRLRRNRPAYAADRDVTFRDTEPAKMRARTYAPLSLFLWLEDGRAVSGKLVDVYKMAELEPRLGSPFRQRIVNPDGTSAHVVTIAELVAIGALLAQGDRHRWAPACIDADRRVDRIVAHWAPATPAPPERSSP